MSQDIFEVIHSRRSIRSYTGEKVFNDDLLKIAEAGRASPTSVNQQNRQFTIVNNPDQLKKLSQAVGQAIGQPTYDFNGATALLLVSVPGGGQISAIEVGLAVQNMWLAATALGLGMSWTHQINGVCDVPQVRQVLDELGLPSRHICLNAMAVGIPAEKPALKERRERIVLND